MKIAQFLDVLDNRLVPSLQGVSEYGSWQEAPEIDGYVKMAGRKNCVRYESLTARGELEKCGIKVDNNGVTK
jgi:hypothetical protein